MQKWSVRFLFLLWPLLSHANITGSDTQIFKPSPDGLDFLTVHSSRTLPPWWLNLGLFTNASFNSLLLPDQQTRFVADDVLLAADFNLALGLPHNFEVILNFPASLYHHQSGSNQTVFFEKLGFLDASVGIKYALWQTSRFGLSLLPSVNIPLSRDSYFVGNGRHPIFNTELIADYRIQQWAFGFNTGYRLRNPGNDPGGSLFLIEDQLLFSGALSYHFASIDLTTLFETYSALELRNLSKASKNPVETLLAAKYIPSNELSLVGGMAFGLNKSIGNPTFRVFLGANYYFDFVKSPPEPSSEWQGDLKQIQEYKKGKSPVRIILAMERVFFKFDEDRITPEGRKKISDLAAQIKKNPNITEVRVEGHTDSTGDPAYNLSLSEDRAKTVKHILIEEKIPATKIPVQGFGETQPLESNATVLGRSRNRRVEVIVK